MTRTDRLVALCVGLATFLLYYRFSIPTVGMRDAGELSLVAWGLGIAHPTGYPLWALFGRLFTLTGDVTGGLTTFSALCGAGAVAALTLCASTAITRLYPAIPPLTRSVTSVTAGAGLALAYSFALQGVAVEVYSLTYLGQALVLLLWSGLCGLGAGIFRRRSYWLGTWILALGMGNHGTMLFFLIAWAVWTLLEGRKASNPSSTSTIAVAHCRNELRASSDENQLNPVYRPSSPVPRPYTSEANLHTSGEKKPSLRTVLLSFAGLMLLGASVYLLLPIRAAQHPQMNWGDPATWERFRNHVLAQQYQGRFMREGLNGLVAGAGNFLGLLWDNMGVMIAFAGLGLLTLGKGRTFLVATLLTAGGVLFFALAYDIPDIEQYYVPVYLIGFLWAGLGIAWGAEKIGRRGWILPLAILAIQVPFAGRIVFARADLSREYAGEVFGRLVLDSANPNALVLTYMDDAINTGTYVQSVRSYRRDVLLIERAGLTRVWYVEKVLRDGGDRFPEARPVIEDFLTIARRRESGQTVAPTEYAQGYRHMVRAILESAALHQPVMIGFDREAWVYGESPPAPQGILYRTAGPPLSERDPLLALDLSTIAGDHPGRDPHTTDVLGFVGEMMAAHAYQALADGDTLGAIEWRQRLRQAWPDAVTTLDLEKRF